MAFAFNPLTGKLDLVGSGGSATTNASLLTSGTLALARLDPLVARDDLNNNFSVGQTILAAANTSALTASYSVTGANTTPLLDLSGTWNTTGAARGILLNITDTASAATSLLADFRVGGTSRFSVDKTGGISSSVSGTSQNAISYGSGNFFLRGDGVFQSTRFEVNGLHGRLDNLGVRIRSTAVFGFCSSDAVTTSSDTILARDAANTLALRNGGTAGTPVPQNFRVYNWGDTTNFERGFMRWNSNVLEIGTEAGGTGTARLLSLFSAGGNVIINPASGSSCVVQSGSSASLSVGITGEALARARLQLDAVAFGPGGSSSRDMFLMRNSSTLFEINNGTAGTGRDLKLRNLIQASGVATTVTPSSNGDLVIEQTANTTLTFKMRGTDGTVRSATLTLA